MRKGKVISLLIISTLVLGIALITLQKKDTSKEYQQTGGTDATLITETEAELLDARGNPVNFDDFKGKVVFINNWASWCPPCIAEMPTIEQLKASFEEEEKLVFVMVSFDQNRDKALQWMESKGFDLPVYFPAQHFPQAYITNAIPATFILDKNGALVHNQLGMADYSSEDFKQKMKQWINQ